MLNAQSLGLRGLQQAGLERIVSDRGTHPLQSLLAVESVIKSQPGGHLLAPWWWAQLL